jgi:hypothetical protein
MPDRKVYIIDNIFEKELCSEVFSHDCRYEK